jgi:hypothetical protein
MGVFILSKVKMLTSMAGHNFSLIYGDEVEVSDEVAKAWEESGIGKVIVVEDEPNKKATLKKGDK